MRRILAATAALVLFSTAGPGACDAEAGLCRIYCESITVGCKVTFGKIDDDYCDSWQDGCAEGCRVSAE